MHIEKSLFSDKQGCVVSICVEESVNMMRMEKRVRVMIVLTR